LVCHCDSLTKEAVIATPETLNEPRQYRALVERIRDSALTTAELAQVTGVKPRQVQHWAAGAHRPQGDTRDRLLEVAYIVEQLHDVYAPEGVDIWIHGRNRDLEGRRPIDLLRAGDFETVLRVVERLQAGAA
jgi:uncharacterized protein (DUF2384 family)